MRIVSKLISRHSAAALAALLLLTACTGTQENVLPTLLVVGSGTTGGTGQLELLEVIYEPGAQPPRRLEAVAGSERPLPAPPVALDVIDRNGTREELVVLVRRDGTGTAGAVSELHFYSLSNLNPREPATFQASREPIDLLALLEPLLAPGAAPCLSDVSVGREGRYVALLDDGECRSGGIADVYLADLQTGGVSSLISLSPALEILPAGIFVDQESTRLYFTAEAINAIEVRSAPLAAPGDDAPEGSVTFEQMAGVTTDMVRAGSGIALLANSELALLPLMATSDEVAAGTTLSGARELLPDPSGNLEELVVFSATRLAIHEGTDDEDSEEFPLEGQFVDATLDPVQRFAYLLEVGGIEILDLFPYAEPPSDRLLFLPLEELSDPRVITWVYAARQVVAAP